MSKQEDQDSQPTMRMGRTSIRQLLIGTAFVVTAAVFLVLAGFSALMFRAPKSGRTMRFVSKITIPATHSLLSGTDYATVHDGTVYVAYGSADTVLAINSHTGVIGSFATEMTGVHGVAFSDSSRLAFVSLGGKDKVAVIKMVDSSSPELVPAGHDPDGIVFDHHADLAYVGNNGGVTATLVPATDPAHSFSIPLGGTPEFPQVDESTGLIYQPLEDKSEVVVVSPFKKRVVSRFPLGPCKNPHGSAIDPEQNVLFIGCFNQLLAVMDLKTGALIATIPIGRYVDVVAWDAGLHRVYTANSAGSMTVVEEISPRSYRAIDTIQTAAGGHTLAIDPQTHKVYVVCSRFRGAQVLVFEPLPSPPIH